MDAWYLLYTKPQGERLALENLTRQGYRAYLPMLRARRRRERRYYDVVVPMFPRYLFLQLSDQNEDWGPIRSTIGVANMVRFASHAAVVPGALVDALRKREDADGVQCLPEVKLKPGDRVRIRDGAMAGYEAIFEASSGKERVVLLLELADRSARIEAPLTGIEVV